MPTFADVYPERAEEEYRLLLEGGYSDHEARAMVWEEPIPPELVLTETLDEDVMGDA